MRRRQQTRSHRRTRGFLPALETLEPRALLDASVVISEVMARNGESLLDEDGENSDWIELMNVSSSPVNLANWHLTDDALELDKWSLPAVDLQPGRTVVVFASGKDRDNPTRPLHTNFKLDGDGEYVGLVRPDLTIEDALAPAYPPQVTDISYGVPVALSRQVLVDAGSGGQLYVPTDGSLDPVDISQGDVANSWLDPNLDTSSPAWQNVALGVGFRDEAADPNPDPGEGILIADSVAEFSSFQNRDNWRYGYWDRSADSDGIYNARSLDFRTFSWTGLSTVSDFNHWDGTKWDLKLNAAPKTEMSAEGGHPAGSNAGGPVQVAVRRWTSEVSGTVLVHGQLENVGDGDGVITQIRVNGETRYRREVSNAARAYQVTLAVQQGDLVDFMIDPGPADDDRGDPTRFTVQIEDVTGLVDPGGPLPSLADEIMTDIEAALLDVGSTAYLRIPFTPTDVAFDALTLSVKYDDAFVAYLNGQLIASAGIADPLSAAWNSTALTDRPVEDVLQESDFDVTSALDLLVADSPNVLMIHAINFDARDTDLLMAPRLVGTQLQAGIGQHQYFVTPTPDAENGFGDSQVGPLFVDHDHTPSMPLANEPIVVTTHVAPSFHPVTRVDLNYRVMYGGTKSVPMRDDGTAGDAAAGDNVYTAVIPADVATAGQMIRWSFTARDDQAQISRFPRFDDPQDSEEFFGTVVADPTIESNLPVFHWFVPSRNAAMTAGGTRGSLFYDGEFYDNVRFDLHGQSSSGFPTSKKSMNVDFTRDHRFRLADDLPRMKDFNLLTNFADKSKLRNTLGYEQRRIIGDAYHLAFPVRVQHNGSFFAVYDFVEDGDDRWLERLGLDPEGALYKMYNSLESSVGEKKTRRDEGNGDLQALVAGTRLTGQARTDFIFDNVNLPALVNYLAGFVITSNRDCCHKNYYLYRDTNGTQEWQFMPWDVDLSQGRNWGGFGLAYFDDTMYPDNPLYMGSNNRLIGALDSTPGFREMYLRRVRSLMDLYVKPPGTPAAELPLETRVDQWVALMGDDAARDNQLHRATWGQTGFQTFEEATEILKTQYAAPRREFLYLTQVQPDNTGLRELISGDVGATLSRYFVPSNNSLGQSWTQVAFDDNTWSQGSTGIGFENSPPGYNDLLATDIGGAMNGRTSVYVRVPFQLDALDDISALTLRMKYDDGFIAYLNGVEIARRGVSNGAPSFDMTSNSHSDTLAVQYQDIDITSFRNQLRVGENILAIQGVNQSAGSSDFLILPALVVGRPTAAGGEIPLAQVANPNIDFGAIEFNPSSGNQDEEYIELVNRNSVAVDLSGWRVEGGMQMTLRPGTVLPAGWSLFLTPNAVAFRARDEGPGGGQSRFVQGNYEGHLSNFGETLSLYGADGQLVSTTSYEGNPTDAQQFLKISEVMYHPLGPDRREQSIDATWTRQDFEFIELENSSTNVTLDLTGVQFSDGVLFDFVASSIPSLPPQAHTLVVRNQRAFLARYGDQLAGQIAGEFQFASGLGNSGETLKLEDATGSTVAQFTFSDNADRGWPARADGHGSSLERVEGPTDPNDTDGWRASDRIHGTPGRSLEQRNAELRINEVLARPAPGGDDATEFLNVGSSPVVVAGNYFLSSETDNLDALARFALPEATVDGGQRLTVSAATLGPPGFELDGSVGGTLYLTFGPEGIPTHFVDDLDFQPTEPGQSWGRSPDGSTYSFGLTRATLGSINAPPQIGPLVISEVHYHPAAPSAAALALDPTLGRDDLEFIEIVNPTGQTVSLTQWRLRGDVGYDFADDAELGPGAALLVLPFNPASEANASRLAAFRAEYGVSLNTTLVGGYSGQLNDAGDRVTLQRPGPADDPQAATPVRLIGDEVRFTDQAPWPGTADGLGHSLQRVDGHRVGSDASSWQAAPPTAGNADPLTTLPADFNGDGTVDLADLQIFSAALRDPQPDLAFDLTGDGRLDTVDRDRLVAIDLRTTYGDANFDHQFDSSDLVFVFSAGQYEDAVVDNSTWADGDWNLDGEFDSGDLVLAFATGGYEQGSVGATGVALHDMATLGSVVAANGTSRHGSTPSQTSAAPRSTSGTAMLPARREVELLARDQLFAVWEAPATSDESMWADSEDRFGTDR